MNSLNSVLLEGIVTSRMDSVVESGDFYFQIETKRDYTIDDVPACEVLDVHIQVSGRHANTCDAALKVGMRVRVVGRLSSNHGQPFTSIFVEHVEFKPMVSKKEPKA